MDFVQCDCQDVVMQADRTVAFKRRLYGYMDMQVLEGYR